MNRHVQLPGIRKWAGDDLISLQEESLKVLDSFLGRYGNMVVSGCEVTSNDDSGIYDIAPGMVVLAGTDHNSGQTAKVVPFAGATGMTMPVYLTLEYETHERLYVDNKVKPVSYSYRAVASSEKPEDRPYIEIGVEGPQYFIDEEELRRKIDALGKADGDLLEKRGGIVNRSLLFSSDGATPEFGVFSSKKGHIELCRANTDGTKGAPIVTTTVDTSGKMTNTVGVNTIFEGSVTMSHRFSGSLDTLTTEGIYYGRLTNVTSSTLPDDIGEGDISIIVTRTSDADKITQTIIGSEKCYFRQISATGGAGVLWNGFGSGGDGLVAKLMPERTNIDRLYKTGRYVLDRVVAMNGSFPMGSLNFEPALLTSVAVPEKNGTYLQEFTQEGQTARRFIREDGTQEIWEPEFINEIVDHTDMLEHKIWGEYWPDVENGDRMDVYLRTYKFSQTASTNEAMKVYLSSAGSDNMEIISVKGYCRYRAADTVIVPLPFCSHSTDSKSLRGYAYLWTSPDKFIGSPIVFEAKLAGEGHSTKNEWHADVVVQVKYIKK